MRLNNHCIAIAFVAIGVIGFQSARAEKSRESSSSSKHRIHLSYSFGGNLTSPGNGISRTFRDAGFSGARYFPPWFGFSGYTKHYPEVSRVLLFTMPAIEYGYSDRVRIGAHYRSHSSASVEGIDHEWEKVVMNFWGVHALYQITPASNGKKHFDVLAGGGVEYVEADLNNWLGKHYWGDYYDWSRIASCPFRYDQHTNRIGPALMVVGDGFVSSHVSFRLTINAEFFAPIRVPEQAYTFTLNDEQPYYKTLPAHDVALTSVNWTIGLGYRI